MTRIVVAGLFMLASAASPGMAFADWDIEPGGQPATFEFAHGFAELRDQLGITIVGFPIEPERQVLDRDAVQLTTKGLMAWRKGELPQFHDGVTTYTLEPAQAIASVPTSASAGVERLVECVIRRESGGNPGAVNRSSGASGLGQFLPSTWRTTPYAGYSIFDPVANRNAVRWMIQQGRGREFVTIGGC